MKVTKDTIKVKLDIQPKPQVSPAVRQSWIRFWQKLIAECKREVENDR